MESRLVGQGLPIERIRPDGHSSVWWAALCGDERQALDGVRSKAVIGIRRVGDAHDNAIFGFSHWVFFLLPCDRAAASAAIELRQAAGGPSALEVSGASPQRLLSEDP